MTEKTAASESLRTPEIDEVLRRVGRNLLLFQQIELLLKQLTSNARIEGTATSAQVNHELRRARVFKQTLGQIAGQFADDVLADADDCNPSENLSEVRISTRLTVEIDTAFAELHVAEMEAIVSARNDLVHHFLLQWSPSSEESTRSALEYLHEQWVKARPMRDRLVALVKAFEEAVKAHMGFIASPDGLKLEMLRQSRLVILLGELATRTRRADGWMDLATAAHIVRREEPEELEYMVERYGHRTLKKLLQATELFDITDEPTPKGGTRVLYRINTNFELQIREGPPSDA